MPFVSPGILADRRFHMNLRGIDGTVHYISSVELTRCLVSALEGWTFTRDDVTCLACLAQFTYAHEFRRRIALAVSRRAYTRAMGAVTELRLKPGDSIDYNHTFKVQCRVHLNEDGTLRIDEELVEE
jgi:hypothetical protein